MGRFQSYCYVGQIHIFTLHEDFLSIRHKEKQIEVY